MFALAVGLGLLGLLAWACSGALSAGPTEKVTVSRTSPAAQQAGAPGGADGAALGPGEAARATVTVTASPARTNRARAPAHARKAARASGFARAAASARAGGAARRSGGGCGQGDLVVSLFASRAVYQRSVMPRFTVDVVNTGRAACAFDAGTRSLHLVIKSGHVRVWGLADCARGAASRVLHLQRGVPFVRHISWDRRGSTPACRPVRPTAAPGTYTAAMTAGTARSKTVVFALR